MDSWLTGRPLLKMALALGSRTQQEISQVILNLVTEYCGNNKKTCELIFILLWPQKFAGRKLCECTAAKIYAYNVGEFKMSSDGEESTVDDDMDM